MDANQKNILEAKKHQIQLRIRVNEFIDRHLLNWLEIYETILSCNVDHELVQLANVAEDEIVFWETALQKPPFAKFNFDLRLLNTEDQKNIYAQIHDAYPSTYPLRYMPSDTVPLLVSDKPDLIIADFAEKLSIDLEEDVYLTYLYYSPVLKVKLNDIIASAEQLYDFPMEDILIAAPNLDWMIFRSMEDEWRFCKRTTTPS